MYKFIFIKISSMVSLMLVLSTQYVVGQKEQSDSLKPLFSVNGYIQSQYQYFFIPDTVGGTSPYFANFAGGAFASRFTNDRFSIRRGRITLQHGNTDYRSALSFDFTERGAHIKDMYLFFQERKFHALGITMGMFSRPFGYEIGRSSSLRESPERSRVVQTLFPNERDIGVMLGFQMPEQSHFSFINLKAALVNGNGSAVETDKWKDIIGRIGLQFASENDAIELSGGFSVYRGFINHIYEPVDTIASNTNTKYYIFRFESINDPSGRTTKGFVLDSAATFASGRMGGKVERNYYGFDIQAGIQTPFGMTRISGEYMWGTQPTPVYYKDVEQAYIIYNGMNSFSPVGSITGVTWPMYDQPQPYNPASVGAKIKHHNTFIRKMAGGYISFVQDVFQTGFQVVIKYDWYDPNTEIEGKDVVYDEETYLNDPDYIKPYLSPADLKYTTLGFGLNYQYNNHVKIGFFYDNVKNETGVIGPYVGDIRIGRMPSPGYDKDLKDDVLTIRLQYKF